MLTLKSHGFKFSRPEANIVFDVSYFKNPWRDEEIRKEPSRENRKIMAMEYMVGQEGVIPFVNEVSTVLMVLDKFFPNENLQVAFCCSAGEYRSPVMVELVAQRLEELKVARFEIIHSPNSKI